MTRTVSPAGRKALMEREGVRLTAYRDSRGIPTIGVGHVDATPPVTTMGMTISMAQAEALLTADLAPMERAVSASDLKGRLSQNAFDAAVSLAFNIGVGAFARSTVARKIAEGDMAAAADAFLMWDKPAALIGRRRAERTQFLAPDASPTPELDLIRNAVAKAAAEQAKAPSVAPPAPVSSAYLPPVMVQHPAKPALTFWQRIAARLTGRAA